MPDLLVAGLMLLMATACITLGPIPVACLIDWLEERPTRRNIRLLISTLAFVAMSVPVLAAFITLVNLAADRI